MRRFESAAKSFKTFHINFAMSSRGFKYTKGKKVDETEELSFEALEESKMSNSSGKKRKSLNSSLGEVDSTKKNRISNVSATSSTSRSGKSKTKTSTTQKHHYPSTVFSPSEDLLNSWSNNKDHSNILKSLVEEIVAEERQTLNSHAQSDQSKAINGRKYIFESLDAVLSELPDIINQHCTDGIVFEPELKKSARTELRELLESRRLLSQHSLKLQQYEENTSKLAEDYDLWLGSDMVTEKSKAALKEPIVPSTEELRRREYQELLTALEHHCGTILDSGAVSHSVLQQARQTQDALYDAVNKARMEQAGKSKAPGDAKDLLKKMPNLF